LQEWGVDPTKEIPPNPATTKYTDFLLATAAGKVDGGKGSDKMVTPFEKTKIAAYTVGAMTPCMRLYAYLGKELGLFLKQDENHPYKKWIDTYAATDFEVWNNVSICLMILLCMYYWPALIKLVYELIIVSLFPLNCRVMHFK
jgi:thiaminase